MSYLFCTRRIDPGLKKDRRQEMLTGGQIEAYQPSITLCIEYILGTGHRCRVSRKGIDRGCFAEQKRVGPTCQHASECTPTDYLFKVRRVKTTDYNCHVPIAGYTGAPKIDAISLLKVCMSLIASLDRALQLHDEPDTVGKELLLINQPNRSCDGVRGG